MLSIYDVKALYMLNALRMYRNPKRTWIYKSSSDRKILDSLIEEGLVHSDDTLSMTPLGLETISYIRGTLPKDELNALDKGTMEFYEACLKRVRDITDSVSRRRKQ